MSPHAYPEDQIVEQSAIREICGMISTGDRCQVLIESLPAYARNSMLLNIFLFEWKTSA
jgi:hypothetical protein